MKYWVWASISPLDIEKALEENWLGWS